MDFFEIVKQRRSIRAFRPDPVPPEMLEKLVDAARLAPSGANRQPLHFVLVDEPDLLPGVFETLKWAGYVAPRGDPPAGRRPTAYIVVLLDPEAGGAGADAAAAIENILLGAVALGLGACWLGSIDRADLREELGIPGGYRIDSVVALGYPDQESSVAEFTGSVEYWMDEQGNFHVPKRPLADVLHRNAFGRRGSTG